MSTDQTNTGKIGRILIAVELDGEPHIVQLHPEQSRMVVGLIPTFCEGMLPVRRAPLDFIFPVEGDPA